MSKETPTLAASTRERTGSRYARRLRAAGQLPAVLYGHGMDPISIAINEIEIIRHLTEGAHVFELDIEGRKETCLVKDLQFGWLGDNVVHIDLTKVDLDEMVTVNVKLIFKGTPKGASQAGAVLTQDLTELEVSCKVRDIPEEVIVQMDEMEESFNVGELELPSEIKAVAPPETVVCHIVFKAEEEEETDAEDGAEGADGAAPEGGDAGKSDGSEG
jgi:large subunit ribosomal protein L25